jgi:chromosome segregation ATPase
MVTDPRIEAMKALTNSFIEDKPNAMDHIEKAIRDNALWTKNLKESIRHECNRLRRQLDQYEADLKKGDNRVACLTPNLGSTALEIETQQGRLKELIDGAALLANLHANVERSQA